eukprot:CAMPEP_0115545478 /NCGR_PEP_ID=MMETSP0271-20121206/92626_1 /TAXON_ID=71861 /ORGANISM="Scrippsiella trochoidea, Strain CCMP3099" /LENGTH=171 /DNA_ID=CAMNT_0002978829 /DNA_START=146 /DNA_END=659 /DNA_ORIENTATION=-
MINDFAAASAGKTSTSTSAFPATSPGEILLGMPETSFPGRGRNEAEACDAPLPGDTMFCMPPFSAPEVPAAASWRLAGAGAWRRGASGRGGTRVAAETGAGDRELGVWQIGPASSGIQLPASSSTSTTLGLTPSTVRSRELITVWTKDPARVPWRLVGAGALRRGAAGGCG